MKTILSRLRALPCWILSAFLVDTPLGRPYPKHRPLPDDDVVRRIQFLRFETDAFLFHLQGWIRALPPWGTPLPGFLDPGPGVSALGEDAPGVWRALNAKRRGIIATPSETEEGALAKLYQGVSEPVDWEMVRSALRDHDEIHTKIDASP